MQLTPLVQNTVERLAEIVPLSPMAQAEIDSVLLALCEEVSAAAEARGRAAGREEAASVAEGHKSVSLTVIGTPEDVAQAEFYNDIAELVALNIAAAIRALT